MNRLVSLIAALLVSGFVAAEENTYLIQCTILNGDQVLGAPTVVAESGKEVKVSVTDTYDLAITAEEQDGRVALSADITIAGESHSPALLLDLDRSTEIRIGDTAFRFIVSKFVPGDA